MQLLWASYPTAQQTAETSRLLKMWGKKFFQPLMFLSVSRDVTYSLFTPHWPKCKTQPFFVFPDSMLFHKSGDEQNLFS